MQEHTVSRIATCLLALTTLAGCASKPLIASNAQPVGAQCATLCYTPCDTTMPLWNPKDPDSPDAWDELAEQVVIPSKGLVEQCELHRRACDRCLDRLRANGVIR